MDEFPSGMNMIVAVLAYTGKQAVVHCAVCRCARQETVVVVPVAKQKDIGLTPSQRGLSTSTACQSGQHSID